MFRRREPAFLGPVTRLRASGAVRVTGTAPHAELCRALPAPRRGGRAAVATEIAAEIPEARRRGVSGAVNRPPWARDTPSGVGGGPGARWARARREGRYGRRGGRTTTSTPAMSGPPRFFLGGGMLVAPPVSQQPPASLEPRPKLAQAWASRKAATRLRLEPPRRRPALRQHASRRRASDRCV